MVLTIPGSFDFASLGADFSAQCTVEGNAAVVDSLVWYKNGTVIRDEQNSRISITTNNEQTFTSTLSLIQVQRDDGGEYYCEAFFSNMDSITSNRVMIPVFGEWLLTVIYAASLICG